MDIYEALYTTRAMRRVKPDPIPQDVQMKILDAAVRAPTGGNEQAWRFLFVDDQKVRNKIAPLYRRSMETVFGDYYNSRIDDAQANPDDPESQQWMRVHKSASWLRDNIANVPLLWFSFYSETSDPNGGSIFPAVWNGMLAARAEGIGAALTGSLLLYHDEVLEVLGVPLDQGWKMVSMVTLGYPLGRWGIAPRRPVHHVANRNQWDQPIGFEIPEPLWSKESE
ncbi:MAG: nitroreductase family protein [Pseudomonadota bacterium]